MARSRIIKPGFFKNEELAECEPLARLLWAGLWTIADRNGMLEYRPGRIKTECLPYDACSVSDLIAQLVQRGFLRHYQAGGKELLAIPNFRLHQPIHPKEPSFGWPLENAQESEPGQNRACPDLPGQNPLSLTLTLSQEDPPNPPSGGTEPPTAEEFVAIWNASRAFQPCRKLTGRRLRAFRQRLRDPDWRAEWRQALDRAARVPQRLGVNSRGTRPYVDWFLRPLTVTRILEGYFEAEPANGTPQAKARPNAADAFDRARERQKARTHG